MKIDRLVQLLGKGLQLRDAHQRQADVDFCRELMPEASCASARGSGADHAFFLENKHIGHPTLRMLVCDAPAPYSSADDNHLPYGILPRRMITYRIRLL